MGFAEALVDGGRWLDAVNLWVGGRPVARAVLGLMGTGLSPFPYALVFAQDEHERLPDRAFTLITSRGRLARWVPDVPHDLADDDPLPG